MTIWQYIPKLVIVGTLIGAMIPEPTIAQRGGGDPGDGQRGGQGGDRGGGGREGGGRSGQFSGRSGGESRRSISSPGESRGPSSQGQSMRQTDRQGDRGDSSRRSSRPDFSSQPQRNQQGLQGQRQQSFFRGPASNEFDGRQRENTQRDAFQNRTQQRDRDFDRVRDSQGSDWRDRVFSDNPMNDNRFDNDRLRDGRVDNDRLRDNRFDNDRIRDNRDNLDRRLLENRTDWTQESRRIRDDWRRRDRNDLPFRWGWWDNQRVSRWPIVSPWRYSWWRDRPYYWWGWTTAPALTDWIVFGWDRPYYWDYGPGGNIYYRDDYVYYDNNRYLPVNQYYREVYDLAHSVPQIDPSQAEQMDWKPLGVFAAIRDNDPNQRNLQLAVNKDGVLSGTYYNTQNGQVHPLTGMVDDRTQRAAWAFADGEHPEIVFETSIYNLTEPESSMMVHFGPQSSQAETWRLVRLERPEASGGELPVPQSVRGNQLP